MRKSWSFHGKVGCYVGPAQNHYQYYCIYIPETASKVITDTLQFLPHKIPFPTTTIKDHLKLAIENIVTLLSEPQPTLVPNKKQMCRTSGMVG